MPTSASLKNRRISVRRAARKSSRITCRKGCLGLGPNLAIQMLDLSESGVRFVSKIELKVGEQIEVGMLAPGGIREILRTAAVVWTLPTADGSFCIGAAFEKRLEYAMLTDLSQPTPA
jgi:PilZ domain-containing protein